MKKYLHLMWVLMKQNLILEMEFRRNFFIRLISQGLFVIFQIVVVETFFKFTSSIGTWSRTDVLVLVGLFRLIEGAFHMLVHSNLLYLPEIINAGELDSFLSKPISPLFLVSFRKHQWYEATTFISGIIILAYSFKGTVQMALMGIPIVAILGFVSLYSIMLFFASWSFFVSRLTAIGSFWDALSKTSRFPLDIFGNVGKAIFFIAPFMLVVTLPSQIVLGKVGLWNVMLLIGGAFVLLFGAWKFWNFALKRYSSASS